MWWPLRMYTLLPTWSTNKVLKLFQSIVQQWINPIQTIKVMKVALLRVWTSNSIDWSITLIPVDWYQLSIYQLVFQLYQFLLIDHTGSTQLALTETYTVSVWAVQQSGRPHMMTSSSHWSACSITLFQFSQLYLILLNNMHLSERGRHRTFRFRSCL